ncbi:uncharacterized protein LY89DRAFT_684741 [Mollisia scopiformis]|uniref:Copper acquisition factor BIM1-like domain-containing protein n=1 Tax=Mollisia scopiformis TaxID=149040 RepID=A0A194XCC8_MOLSC|nr:uncharacterized protein LY89DRAFT_684741 [Mollisia scopiformis]KUJ17811.1 hypothetical protein LY89DRAFT_684741 [Mollisia scopiformis]
MKIWDTQHTHIVFQAQEYSKMFTGISYAFAALPVFIQLALGAHGDGAEGTVMGPVAFLWPSDRVWSAAYDNVGPCGSSSSVTNRTEFPLGSIGSIELTIADESYNLAVRIAYGNDPATQEDFQAVKNNVSELEPGHQCYSMPAEPSTVVAGSNATIQLEYWADDSDKNESFFACADIVGHSAENKDHTDLPQTFVEASAFNEQVICFNVTASEFDTPSSTASSAPTATQTPASTSATAQHSSGLSGGAKAGIAVGCIVGGILLLAAIVLFTRRRRAHRVTEVVTKPVEKPIHSADIVSIGSEDTAH